MSEAAVFFLSDAHLGAEPRAREAARERRLHRFLTSLPGRASELFIVGDLFDFWFEYRTAIPRRHFDTLAELRRLRASGVKIAYLTGNHDFYLGSFLSDELGLETHGQSLSMTRQQRRIWIHHGDGLIGGDLGYRILKRVLRHPASIAAYRWLHPDLGIPLAHWASSLSRHVKGDRSLDGDRLWREVAAPRIAEGFDTVMIGHFHHAFERRDGNNAFFVLGDWVDQFTYVVLENGELRLEVWPEG
ncbi:MAG TPA: UDP-2,3-diacylglucosamine diphosphatase [Candidatus Limnocylindria bacterium]|nr:UDP-2,3-diacylglucosamine diphosphatase [Candidatus Limnocylindria bacterium]